MAGLNFEKLTEDRIKFIKKHFQKADNWIFERDIWSESNYSYIIFVHEIYLLQEKIEKLENEIKELKK